MTIRDILVPLFPSIPSAEQLKVAADLALRLRAHVKVVFTRPDPVIAAAFVPEMIAATGVVLEAIETEGKRAQAAAFQAFDLWRTAYGLLPVEEEVPANSIAAAWHERIGSIAATMIEIGRLSTLTIIRRPDPYEIVTEEAFAAAVFETGRPAIITPPTVRQSVFHHVVVAWNGSLEAARAIDGAMPILRLAETVSIFAPPEAKGATSHRLGLVEHLSWHGIQAGYLETDAGVVDVGRALTEGASAAHATMIVMGAYSHSRIRDAVLGGVTRHVLKHAEIPVLMMH
jgi:nucleotide-binding universal stress UspA family protein